MSAPLDDRGVSEVLGAVLVFGIVVMLLGMLQTFAVPQENQEVEFQHSQQVADQMADLRATALDVARDGGTKTANVKLGTSYPTRFVLLNPPDATGTLRTTGAGEISSTGFSTEDVCGTGSAVESRTLEYESRYNAYSSAPSIGFEHGFTYRKYDDEVRVENEQRLFQGNTITLLPFVDEYAAEGSDMESIDLASTGTGGKTVSPGSDFTVTVPTRLDASDWQDDDLLGDEIGDRIVSIKDAGGNRIDITFEGDNGESYNVRCALLGIDSQPEGAPPSIDEEDEEDPINPTRESGSLVLLSASSSDNLVEMEFENSGETWKNVTAARINFFYSAKPGSDSVPDTAELRDQDGTVLTEDDMEMGGSFQTLDPNANFDSDDAYPLTAAFHYSDSSDYEPPNTDIFYVMTFRFEDGSTSTYFVEYKSRTS